jgi:hypothetical protein
VLQILLHQFRKTLKKHTIQSEIGCIGSVQLKWPSAMILPNGGNGIVEATKRESVWSQIDAFNRMRCRSVATRKFRMFDCT